MLKDVLRNYVLRVVQLAEAKASVNNFTEPTLQLWQFGCLCVGSGFELKKQNRVTMWYQC